MLLSPLRKVNSFPSPPMAQEISRDKGGICGKAKAKDSRGRNDISERFVIHEADTVNLSLKS